MAGDPAPKPNVMGDALMFFGAFLVLVFLWYMAGGPGKADLRGLFLAPPQPLGTGEAYGPTFGSSTSPTASSTQTIDAPPTLEEYTSY